MIHMESDDGRKLTLVLNPFLVKVGIAEEYLESDNMRDES